MATAIRLKRFGKKKEAHYRIIVCDSRIPRDGRPIEELGAYNPNTDPYVVTINKERIEYWLKVGAQPSDTVRNILRREGILLAATPEAEEEKPILAEAAPSEAEEEKPILAEAAPSEAIKEEGPDAVKEEKSPE